MIVVLLVACQGGEAFDPGQGTLHASFDYYPPPYTCPYCWQPDTFESESIEQAIGDIWNDCSHLAETLWELWDSDDIVINDDDENWGGYWPAGEQISIWEGTFYQYDELLATLRHEARHHQMGSDEQGAIAAETGCPPPPPPA